MLFQSRKRLMIITVGNTKGGVGKTTIALNIAIALRLKGHEVWLIDGDRQNTAQTAVDIRAESQQQPEIACSSFSEGKTLRNQIRAQQEKYEYIVIDAGGRDSTALRAALVLTDVLLVPFQPRSYDVWALHDIAELVDEAHGIRDGLKAYAVLNCADPGDKSNDNVEAAKAVQEVPQFQYLDTPLRRRKAFANAAGAGLSVLELKPTDAKAIQEINQLVDAILN